VEERWGLVFCWHDPENKAPDFPLPEIPEWDDPQFVRWQSLDHVADLNHPVEIFDNESDAPHLELLHGGGTLQAYENEVDGHVYHQRETMIEGISSSEDSKVLMGDKSYASPAGVKTMTTVGAYHGTGLMLARFIEANGVQLMCTTPVNDGQCRVMSGAMLKSPT
jgi:3-ketosteroid 9alpha-monooxygenase subunit A